MGPLISAAHRATVASYLEGVTSLFRGEVPEKAGFWYPCTLVEASNDDRIAREEVFGPVAAVIPFDDEADAIRIANDTPYGLSGSIWTRDGARAIRVARALETGVLSVNSNSSVRPSTPFGGFKQSGFGRELGMAAMDGYSEIKSVFFSTERSSELMGRLDGKVCVITGAGGGMGREAAILFTAEGAKVCAADVAIAAAEETVTLCEGEAFAFPVDVADEGQVAAMMAATAERFGGIDVLYNNAGISPDDDASILDTSVEAWQRVQDVNTKGVFLCCKHGIPYLQRRGGGSVVNVASFVAILGAATSQISYTASKGAVLSMSRELAVQFARENIRVNALCPGPVETPLLLNIFGDDPAALERRRIHWPTGRLGKPREIVNGALFLASDESSYVTGSTFLVDGGLTAAYVTPE